MSDKPRIAHLSGANATIGNSPPLVTSNKARAKYGLPLKTNPDGSVMRFDMLRTQRLAARIVRDRRRHHHGLPRHRHLPADRSLVPPPLEAG